MGAAAAACAGSAPPGPLGITATGKPANAPAEPSGPSDLEAAVRQAQLQRVAGDLDGAIRTLGQLVLVAPDDPRIVGEYGKTLVAKGETSDALAFLGRAISLQPNDWMLYSAQGVAYDQSGNYPAAYEAYSKALALKPGEPSVLSNAGLSRLQAGDLDGAEKLLKAATQSGADNGRIARNLALLESLKDKKVSAAPVPPAPTAPAVETAKAAPAAPQAPAAAPVPRVVQTSLPAPAAPAAPLTGIAALAADPTVVMAPIPRDDAEQKPKPKAVPAKTVSGPPRKLAETTPPIRLRPAQ